MSEEMGPIEYGENQEEVFLGRSVTQTQSVSEEVAQKIDKEIRKLIDEGYNKAKEILTEKIDDLHKIAKALITYETLTGEEIENIIDKNLYPKDKVMMGAERRSMVMTEDEKKLTAYHEGGHALVSFNMPSYDPIHKATIIPRGRALGMVMNLPERDKHGYSIKYLKARMAVCFGGRVAE